MAKKLRVVFEYKHEEPVGEVTVVWDPAMPKAPSNKISARYYLARDAFLAQVAKKHSVTLAVAGVEGVRTIKAEGGGVRKDLATIVERGA